ncbi:hypothetical protein J4573_27955 [Actinomadura barringtoniae]|uniref:Uncharacterized protein n=1 Tax=Actinomadura barringtoniae TaxID=1427535 RepID=A0A939PLX5_9ACTN|nr:hypothetical protein [Actinomadura barringtoniae]MBO2450961.1 hypothetical protein [Actinomadura barringtoniae]
MHIKWNSLAEVSAVSLVVGVGIVVVFAVGVLALSGRPETETGRASNRITLPTVAAGLCFLACALITAYGIYLIVPQFH